MHKSKKNHKFGEHRGFSSDLCLNPLDPAMY